MADSGPSTQICLNLFPFLVGCSISNPLSNFAFPEKNFPRKTGHEVVDATVLVLLSTVLPFSTFSPVPTFAPFSTTAPFCEDDPP